MLNLLKYKFLGTWKKHGIVMLVLLLINIYCIVYGSLNVNAHNGKDVVLYITFSTFTTFAALVFAFISSFSSLSKELKSDSAYLLMTLPVNSYEIMGSKVIESIIYYLYYTIIPTIMSFATMSILITRIGHSMEFGKMLTILWTNPKPIFAFYFSVLLGIIALMLTYNFAQVLSRSLLKNNKYGKLLSFVVFFFTIYVISSILDFVDSKLPLNFTVNFNHYSGDIGNMVKYSSDAAINVAPLIVCTIIYIGLFFATSYLMEKKMDA